MSGCKRVRLTCAAAELPRGVEQLVHAEAGCGAHARQHHRRGEGRVGPLAAPDQRTCEPRTKLLSSSPHHSEAHTSALSLHAPHAAHTLHISLWPKQLLQAGYDMRTCDTRPVLPCQALLSSQPEPPGLGITLQHHI